MKRQRFPKPPKGADPLLWHALQMARANETAAAAAVLDAAADAKARGMHPDHIAQALGVSRATLYRRMVDRW